MLMLGIRERRSAQKMVNVMPNQELIVMCGLPGSGKSYWAESYVKTHPSYEIISTDKMRQELFGDESDQSNNWLVFVTAYQRLVSIIESGKSAIFDATNLKRKDRKKIVKFFSRYNIPLKLVWMNTPMEVCKLRNSQRKRFVENLVIDKMSECFIEPTREEGWDDIIFNKIVL